MRTTVLVPPDIDAYWRSLLEREGIAHADLTSVGVDESRAAVLFLPPTARRCSADVATRIDALHEAGVPIVMGAATANELFGVPSRSVTAHGIVGSGEPFAGCPQIRSRARIVAPVGATVGRVWPSDAGARLDELCASSKRIVLALPDARDLDRAKPRLARFESAAGFAAHEIVSAWDHGALRRFVANALRTAFHARGLPWITKATAPIGYAGMFAFRVDADGYRETSTRLVADAMREASMRASWYIDVERHQLHGGAPAIRRLLDDGHDVQSHHFHHYTYGSARRNRRNLERAAEVLRAWGASPIAAVAPFGTYTAGLHDALSATATAYSSEFSRLHDDLPGAFPGPGGRPARWQVPAHPICPASLMQVGASEHDVVTYFCDRLTQSVARGEPAVLYGHPIGDLERCPDLFRALHRRMDELASTHGQRVWRGTVTELFEFFARRAAIGLTTTVTDDAITLRSTAPLAVSLHWPDGRIERLACGPTPRRVTRAPERRADARPHPMREATILIPRPCDPPSDWTEPGRRDIERIERRIRFARFAVETRRDLRTLPHRVLAAARVLSQHRTRA